MAGGLIRYALMTFGLFARAPLRLLQHATLTFRLFNRVTMFCVSRLRGAVGFQWSWWGY